MMPTIMMVATFEIHAVAQISAARMLDCIVGGSIIALIAGGALRLSHRQTSGTRFAVWFAVLLSIAALPLLSSVMWSYNANMPASFSPSAITLPSAWALYLFGLWAAVATWFLARLGVGLWHVHVLRRSCVAIDTLQLDTNLRETLERNCRNRSVSLCTSDQVQVPTAIGLVAPLVVIPSWLLDELSPDELDQILLHELAHLRRWDDWTNLVQKVVAALFFFHPAVWWIEKQVSLEREMACDDDVLSKTSRPRAYAECLAHLAEKTLLRRTLALAQAAIGRVHQTSLRVARILDSKWPRETKHDWSLATPLITTLAIASVLLASKQPHLIAFQDAPQNESLRAVALSQSGPIRVVPAAFKTAALPEKISLRPRLTRVAVSNSVAMPHRVTLSKTNVMNPSVTHVAQRPFANIDNPFLVNRPIAQTSLVHLKESDGTSIISTEAVFLFVADHENSAPGTTITGTMMSETTVLRTTTTMSRRVMAGATMPGMSIYEIHLWRLTVFHPVVRSVSAEFPSKKI